MHLTFEEGTLLLRDYKGGEAPPAFAWDARVDLFRAQAHFYREILNYLKRERITFKNTAPRYQTLSLIQQSPPTRTRTKAKVSPPGYNTADAAAACYPPAPANRRSRQWPYSKSSAARLSLLRPST